MKRLLLLTLLGLASVALASPPKTSINVWLARNVAPGKKIQLTLNTRNVPVVGIVARPVDGLAWLSRSHGEADRPKPSSGPSTAWTVTVAQKGQARNPTDNYFSRQVNLPIQKPGVYLLTISGGGVQTSTVVNVTNLAVILKRSKTQSLAWVTDFHSGATVAGASILYFNDRGEKVAADATGPDGTALTKISAPTPLAVVRRGDDLAGVEAAQQNHDGRLVAHFQTDRPIYRPGQTVFFKAILRLTNGPTYRAIVDGDVAVTLRDPRDNPIDATTCQPTAAGTVSGSFRLPAEGMIGGYTLVLATQHQQAYQTVSVAAYRKPEFKVEPVAVAKRYLSGEEAKFEVRSSYYFGAALPQAQVTWVARRNTMDLSPASDEAGWFASGDGNLYPRDTYSQEPFVAEGTGFTDNEGRLVVSFKTDPKGPDSTYSIEFTVTDSGRRQVKASASVPVYASSRRIGITSEKRAVALGGLVPVQIRLVDLDGNPVSGKVTLQVISNVWNEKKGEDERHVLTTTTANVPTTGRASAALPANAEGDLQIEASTTDSTGRRALASLDVYVFATNYKPQREVPEPTLEVRLDKTIYEPGQTAHVYVTSNTVRPILLVCEGEEIWTYKVATRSTVWDVKTGLQHSPNAVISADEWTPVGRRAANVVLPVPDRSKLIKVEALANQSTYRPGDTARFTVRTTDSKGRGVPAEVALAVVDEAIYALSPDTTADPYRLFWGTRGTKVASYYTAPEEVSGGAYQRANALAPVRQRFEDTAYWSPTVRTGPDGRATVTFEMPGNLTQWRATARAVTSDTRVGSGRASVLATRPLTMRLAVPRTITTGDTISIIGTVNNRSDKTAKATISLDVEGLRIISRPDESIDVPAKGQATAVWTLQCESTGLAKLLARATADGPDMSDALQVSVPMIPRGVSRTTLTGGTLTGVAESSFAVPEDAIADAASVHVRVTGGLSSLVSQMASEVLRSGRYGSPAGANMLEAATVLGPARTRDDTREALALLSRVQAAEGWGWWENSPSDPIITSRVLTALSLAKSAGIGVYGNLLSQGTYGAMALYDRTNLWEQRALLAAAVTMAGEPKGLDKIKEVRERGKNVSPFAKLRMAEALATHGNPDAAKNIVAEVRSLVSDSATSAYLPTGDGIGWTANSMDTTAQLLIVLARLDYDSGLHPHLARYLTMTDDPQNLADDTKVLVARALAAYSEKHASATALGSLRVVVGDKTVQLVPSKVDSSASGDVEVSKLTPGNLSIHIERDGTGEALWQATLKYYRNALDESKRGVRVVQRFEVRNAAGVWVEVDRTIRPGEPVRCTVTVWGDDLDDAVKVIEPLPAGFEFVDSEYVAGTREEVRDGAVVHYMINAGTPATFRYYIRAEADGRLMALPAIAEYLRRPGTSGQSSAEELSVGNR